jgi:hypothetical protein
MTLLYGCFVKGLLQTGEFQVKRLFSALGIRRLALGWFALAGHGKSGLGWRSPSFSTAASSREPKAESLEPKA